MQVKEGDVEVDVDAAVGAKVNMGIAMVGAPVVVGVGAVVVAADNSNLKNVIAVGSGKGGVGKSTVAVNLALALHQEGSKVGLLDADIYGPSIPIMCGVKEGEKPTLALGDRIVPINRFGMPLMSMGFLMASGDAVIWRGPMLAKMLQQFLELSDTNRLFSPGIQCCSEEVAYCNSRHFLWILE